MKEFALGAVAIGLMSILGCDTNANRTATNDRTTSPSAVSPTTPSIGSPSGSVASSAEQMSAADQALAQRITSSLQEDASLAGAMPNMTVQASNGTVTLKGSVNTQQQRSAIESKVRSVAGVTQVVNNLEVASASR